MIGAIAALLSAPGSAGQSINAQALVDAHNRVRATHCAPPLKWSAKVAASAQKWADTLRGKGCALQHSGGRYGENLAAGTTGLLDAAGVTGMWYGESKKYSFHHPGFSMSTGHFTQVVWRDTKELGCARAQCSGLDVWVCQYDPPGNVEGQYRENVLAPGCR
jgi:uncharacterized protein YkwD